MRKRLCLDTKTKKDDVHVDAIWAKTFCSFVKMKVRKGQASLES